MITKLTSKQEEALAETYNTWLDIGRSIEPLNKGAVKSVISAMYEKIGEKPPVVLFFSSPIMCCLAYSLLKNTDFESQLESQLRSQLGSQLRSQLGSQLESQLGSQLGSQLSNYCGGQQWCAWEVFYDFCRNIGVNYKPEENSILDLWLNQSKECHWWFPYKGIVLASERPIALHLNERGQLHADEKMAIKYSDGWGIYALNGVRMDEKYVNPSAEQLDASLILNEQNVEIRRELLRKVGIERFLQVTKHKEMDKQGDYSLLSVDLSDEHKDEKFLKMLNQSIGVWHVEGVPLECLTVKDALHARKPKTLREVPIDNINGEDWYQQGDVCIWPKHAKSVKFSPAILT